MARATVGSLKMILDNTELSYSILSAYLDDANVLVTEALGDKGLSESLLTVIEKWIAAHLIVSTRERVAKEEGAGTAYIKYAGDWGAGLTSTSYGQTAISYDTSNTLLALSEGKKTASSRAVVSFDDSELL